MPDPVVPSERDVEELATRILRVAAPSVGTRVREALSPDARLMRWTIERPGFKTGLFRFVDVFPACTTPDDVLRHLDEYLGDEPAAPRVVRGAIAAAEHVPFGARLATTTARVGIRRMARRFVAGRDAADALPRIEALWRRGFAVTVDLLGEKTLTLADADAYAARLQAVLTGLARAASTWPERAVLEHDPWGTLPRVNLSVKASALAPLLGPTTVSRGIEQAMARLGPVLEAARDAPATVHLDTEYDELKDATYILLREIGRTFPAGPRLGCVVQAYRTDAERDLQALVDWSAATLAAPLQVRLVKGAYWDAETIRARAQGWRPPVWPEKDATDAAYERCAAVLVAQAGAVRPAFASHNARSLAFGLCAARAAGLPDDAVEMQVLHGMAEPLHGALRDLGLRTRVYVPIGELVPGMAYLVRRLLENTSNESFVRHRYTEHRDVDELVEPPHPHLAAVDPVPAGARTATDPDAPGEFEHEPHAELRRPEVQQRLLDEVAHGESALGFRAPLLVDGREVATTATIVSVDPGHVETVVCESASATPDDAVAAIEVARRAAPAWAATAWPDRAAVLFRAARAIREQRDALSALVVFEAGKPIVEADADVCEAIDFLEYYGRRALDLGAGVPIVQAPGETNAYEYRPRGVGVVIAPWNFPLAIPAGMVAAALVTGNAVVFKPAEQTPGVAWHLVRILHDAGVPPGALAFLPGVGEEIGPVLVDHPDVSFVTFTGSRAVGLGIVRRAGVTPDGQRHVKRVVAEMGGKNPVVVDADADLDEAVPHIVQSAFGYAGQKCSAASRVLAVGATFDALVERIAGAVELVPVGHQRELATVVGPLIDADAVARVHRYREIAARDGRVVIARDDVPADGHYVGPSVVALGDQTSPVARDEIFGPLLAVVPAPDFDTALAMANDTEYALTAGCFSRSPVHLRRAAVELRAGNVYLNRGITGALVGRQPFGGYGLSGVGSKAGGPDYLRQFVDPRTITENTLRQGFAPE